MRGNVTDIDVAAPPDPATFAGLVWPAKPGVSTAWTRAVFLAVAGSCILALSAKIAVPGPVNMTLQTLAVLVLGAVLGWRLALASVLAYLAEGALGLPVFTGTPPLPAGLAYLAGPTGGFLVGFAAAAVIVGAAADRGLIRRPLAFAAVLVAADLVMLACGATWLALGARPVGAAGGIGFAKAFAVGVQPFLLGEAIKVALAAFALPAVWRGASRLLRR